MCDTYIYWYMYSHTMYVHVRMYTLLLLSYSSARPSAPRCQVCCVDCTGQTTPTSLSTRCYNRPAPSASGWCAGSNREPSSCCNRWKLCRMRWGDDSPRPSDFPHRRVISVVSGQIQTSLLSPSPPPRCPPESPAPNTRPYVEILRPPATGRERRRRHSIT